MRKGRLKKEMSDAISRIFNGQPVVDAQADLRVVILSDDIIKGKRKNFDECVFAQACKRVFNSQKVIMMRQVAYISLPDENGDYKVERYIISSTGQKLIADFDRGNLPKAGTSFVFYAPRKNQTLDHMKVVQNKHYKARRQAMLNGELKGSAKKSDNMKRPVKNPTQPMLDVRNGTGLIQMRRHP